MTKAAELAKMGEVLTNSQIGGRRNIVINGAMQVAQRGTSQTGVTADGYYAAPDRYKLQPNSAGTWSVSQSTTSPSGFANSYKVECTTADASLSSGDFVLFEQRFEGQNVQHLKKGTSSAESITVSFWVRSAKTGTYIVEIDDHDNSRNINKSYTISSADTWEHKTITFEGDTTGALDNDNNFSLRVIFWLAGGSDFSSGTLATSWQSTVNANRVVGQVNLADTVGNDWYVTGIQLELGSTATPFEHRSFGEELLLCQRYYYQSHTTLTSGVGMGNPWIGDAINSTEIWGSHRFAPMMRATPDIVIYDNAGNSGATHHLGSADKSSISVDIRSNRGFIKLSGSGLTSGGIHASQYSANAEL